MTELKAFPKIHALGTKYVDSIFKQPVEITEKIDGSQFVFGKINGELKFRSKGAQIFLDCTNKMFQLAVDAVLNMDVPDNSAFYCEYLQKPKHNVLAYERVPKANLMLFGASDPTRETLCNGHKGLQFHADRLGIECVPLLFYGVISIEDVLTMLDSDSVLGNQKIEGLVVKNYKDTWIGDRVYPVMAAKFVSEKFKEVHKKSWGSENTHVGKWQTFKEKYRTEARWMKAVQHLRDNGELVCEPKDIGRLIQEVKQNISEEEIDAIKSFLWKEFGEELLRRSTAGLPEWYKEQLALGEISE